MSDELNKEKNTEPVEMPNCEWKKSKIGVLGEVVTGKTPSKNNPEEWGAEIPFVTPSDYRNYRKYVFSSERKLSKTGIERFSNKVLPENSVLVTCIGSDMGKVVMNKIPVVTNQQINSIIPNPNIITSDFLYYQLVSIYDTLRVYGGDGTAVPILNKSDFESIELFLPPLPEQKAIAGVLSSLDDKIDLLHRQNKTLEAMAETLFRQWFVLSEKKDVKSEKLGDLLLFLKGRKPKTALEICINGLIPQILIETFDTGKTLYSDPSNMIIAEDKDILMVMDGASSGRVEIGFNGIVGSTIGVFRPLEKFNYPIFLFYFLKTNEDFIKDNTTGSAIPHADKSLILDLDVEYDLGKVKEFEKIAFNLFEKKQNNKNQIRTLEKLRDTLLPKLMSGEVRVKM